MKPTSPFAAFLSSPPARSKQAVTQRPSSVAKKSAAPIAKQAAPNAAMKHVPRARQATRMMFTELLGSSPNAGRSIGTGRGIYAAAQPAQQQTEPQQTGSVSDPTAVARRIIDAGRMARSEIDGPAIKAPPAGSTAARIIAAGKRARGEQ